MTAIVGNLAEQLAERQAQLAERQASARKAEEAAAEAKKAALPVMIHSGDFVKNFTPPEYLIGGVVQKGNLYSLTGMTGAGKSAVMLRIFAHIALGLKIGYHEVEKSKCLYLAGENPDDIAGRWIKQCEDMGVEPADVDVIFIKDVHNLSDADVMARVQEQWTLYGPFGAVCVDTSSAFFTGDDENSNVQAQSHAAMLRGLTRLPGKPTVFTPSHPLKHPNMENLLPRGGGAFLNAVDGNLVAIKLGSVTEVHWHGKHRGPDFDPLPFKLVVGDA